MRMTEIDRKVYGRIIDAWDATQKNMPEEMQSRDVLDFLLLKHDGTFWFFGPTKGSFFYVNEIVPGMHGVLHAINSDGEKALKDRTKVRKILLGILKDLQLHRLAVTIPAPLQAQRAAVADLGFKYEGRLREAAQMQGEWVDVVVFGLVEKDLSAPIKRRKRRRRSRRKPRKKSGTVALISEIKDATREESEKET